MTHNITHMIALKFRRTPRARAWQVAHRMHMAGLANMSADAATMHDTAQSHCGQPVHEWKIVKEETATGATVATLARGTVGRAANYGATYRAELDAGEAGPGYATEATPEGTQTLVPGVTPITTRARLEKRQSEAKRGRARPCNHGLFDAGARAQLDLF